MDKDYEVGRGRPPKHTQYPKGKSGNPKGRPKGARNLRAELEKSLLAPIPMVMNGKQVRITTVELLIKKVAAEISKGSMPAARLLMELMLHVDARSPAPANDVAPEAADALEPDDDQIIRQALARRKGGGGDE
jgi:Family of unknown function (DUF5681)